MVMKSAPPSTFVVPQPQFLLQILVVPFNAPAHMCGRHELRQAGVGRQIGEVVFRKRCFLHTTEEGKRSIFDVYQLTL
ncbi:hypothetical protein LMG28727_07422 [Paraburkholderia kirstenboschensis]|nr:hypothetical protein LMG28727_07422 [Paraburkholderia kirstenboschensis]